MKFFYSKTKGSQIRFFTLIILLMVSYSSYAQMAVYDAATNMTLMANLPEQVAALKAEVAQLQNYNWNSSDAYNQMQTLGGYLQQAGNLATSAQSVNNEFSEYFPGYAPPSNYNQQYSETVSDTRSALESVMQVMASINSQNDLMNQNSNLNAIQNQISGAQGSLQAIQGLSQITAQLASELQVLQKTISAQASAQDAYYSQQLQTQASSQAELSQVVEAGSTNVPNYGTSGNYLSVPDF